MRRLVLVGSAALVGALVVWPRPFRVEVRQRRPFADHVLVNRLTGAERVLWTDTLPAVRRYWRQYGVPGALAKP